MEKLSNDTAVVVLAGGDGSRIGGNKPRLTLAGERLIERTLRQALTWSDAVAVSIRHPAQVEPLDAQLITDAEDVAGPLAGLVSALRFGARSRREFVLTTAVDMPFLPQDLPDRLLEAIGDMVCAIPSSCGQLHPVCSLWRTSAAEKLEDYLSGAQRSLKGFATLVGFREVDWPCEPFDLFFNINTSDELLEAQRRLG